MSNNSLINEIIPSNSPSKIIKPSHSSSFLPFISNSAQINAHSHSNYQKRLHYSLLNNYKTKHKPHLSPHPNNISPYVSKSQTSLPYFPNSSTFRNKLNEKVKPILDYVEEDNRNKPISIRSNDNFYIFNKPRFPMYIDTFKKHLRDHIYKVDNNLIVNLNKIKKLKHSLSVEDYQKSLILNSNNILSKDSIEDMTKWFRDMRKRNKVKRVNNIPFIRMIEKKEKEIVDEFVKNEEYSIELLHQFGKRVNGWEYNKIKFNRIMAEEKKE